MPQLHRLPSEDSIISKLRKRGESLPRRRKVSVPELGLVPMTTVQEKAVDSPTIPGRFPVHERSNSAPGHAWHRSPPDVSKPTLLSSALSPIRSASPTKHAPEMADRDTGGNRASSILLPDDIGDFILPLLPQSRYTSPKPPRQSPAAVSGNKIRSPKEGSESPPAVPPKSPGLKLRLATQAPAIPTFDNNRSEPRHGGGSQTPVPITAPAGSVSPNPFSTSWQSPQKKSGDETISPLIIARKLTPSHARSASNTVANQTSPHMTLSRSNSFATLKRSKSNGNFSQHLYQPKASHQREGSEGSVLDRGRPTKRVDGIIKRKLTIRSQATENAFVHLPLGSRADEAVSRLPLDEVEALHIQAQDQAENFEVLKYKDVQNLSKELRTLDDRCEYLRKTHLSLREGRRSLHTRMITYLKSPRLSKFSRESMLKQEMALAELDVSIDEWLVKLEQAENRRTRVRQKLLEHVAAALTLQSARANSSKTAVQDEQTPPRSPEKLEESPRSPNRRDVESIKIYAGSEVYALLADIEQEIEQMVEPGDLARS
ncbi:MAG: hypothetical protein Q9160_003344 [Pyrenula sp. 1 TL-2023]